MSARAPGFESDSPAARLAMLGSYAATNFHLATDGNGGTLVSDPPVSSGGPLVPPH